MPTGIETCDTRFDDLSAARTAGGERNFLVDVEFVGTNRQPLPLTPVGLLEFRNALNRAVHQQRITTAERDALWQDVETDFAGGFLVATPVASADLRAKARELSDHHTLTVDMRSLDLLHVAAALLLDAKTFFSFDERQRQTASSEGLDVKP